MFKNQIAAVFFSTYSIIAGAVLLLLEVMIIIHWAAVHITGGILLLPLMLCWLGSILLVWTGVTWVIPCPERTKTILGAAAWHASSALPLWFLFNWLVFDGNFFVNRGLGGAGYNLGGWILTTVLCGIAMLAIVKLYGLPKK